MDPFTAGDPEIEVSGEAIASVVAGMPAFEVMGKGILALHQIYFPKQGSWYNQQAWLDALREIAEKVGPTTLFMIGQQIPEKARWPGGIDDVAGALASIDVAYHTNHRRGCRPLYDAATGELGDGIGNYRFDPTGERSATVTCDTPYPCEFDRGIVLATASKFREPDRPRPVRLEHGASCRKLGAEACAYTVRW